ncbi:hypothetical protein LLG95_15730 [bacterium]|nr:hypothetical protein [bacterium]
MPLSARRKRLIVFLLALTCALSVVVVCIIARFIVHEARHATAIFEKSKGPSSAEIILSKRIEPRAIGSETTSTLSKSDAYAFHFAPLIEDSPDLPPNLRDVMDRINREYDKILVRIDEYEKGKNNFTHAQANQIIGQIGTDMYRNVIDDLRKINPRFETELATGTFGKIGESSARFWRWLGDAYIDASARNGYFRLAGRDSLMARGITRPVEILYLRDRDPDFYYYQSIHYYWQSGTFLGYLEILDAASFHEYDKLVHPPGNSDISWDYWKQKAEKAHALKP